MSHVPRIWLDLPLAVDAQLTLPRDKAHHLHTVLRLGDGDELLLFNDDGNEYTATMTTATRNTVTIHIDSVTTPPRESPLHITLVQAIARGDRMDFTIAKAVELGVTAIQPLFCERGKVRLAGARLDKKQAHWQRVAESAAEQSGRLLRPAVLPARTLADWLTTATSGLRLVLAPAATVNLATLAAPTGPVTLLIGPESGLSDAELTACRDGGFTALRLGPRVLRTETAGMAALAAIQSHWGDLG